MKPCVDINHRGEVVQGESFTSAAAAAKVAGQCASPMWDDFPTRLFSYGECFDETIVRPSPCDTIVSNLTF
jgi:hypothetical protein